MMIGLRAHCYDYGRSCYEKVGIERVIWVIFTIVLINVILETLNLLLLYKRPRSRINLVLGKSLRRKIYSKFSACFFLQKNSAL